MLSVFKKKELNQQKIDDFCNWFIENNQKIIDSLNDESNKMMFMLDEIEAKLSCVYKDGYKKNVEFEYGFNKNIKKYELNLYHLNNKFLINVTNAIANNLNHNLSNTWTINVLE